MVFLQKLPDELPTIKIEENHVNENDKKISSGDMSISDRSSSAKPETVSEIVQVDTEAAVVRRKRGVIAPPAPDDSTRNLTDLHYVKYEKDAQ